MSDEVIEDTNGAQETIEHADQIAESGESETDQKLEAAEAQIKASEQREKSETRRRISLGVWITVFALFSGFNGVCHEKMGEDGQAVEILSNDNWAQYDANKVVLSQDQFYLTQVQVELAANLSAKAQSLLQGEATLLSAGIAKLKKELPVEAQEAKDHAAESDRNFFFSWAFSRLSMFFMLAVLLLGVCMNVRSKILLWSGRLSGGLGLIGLIYGLFLLFS